MMQAFGSAGVSPAVFGLWPKTSPPKAAGGTPAAATETVALPNSEGLATQKFNRPNGHQILARRSSVNFSQRDYFGAGLAVLSQRELFAAVNHRTDNLCRVSPHLRQCCFHAFKIHTFSTGATDFRCRHLPFVQL
jgi:hypothetical protein